MLIAFQVILMILILLFSLGLLSMETKDNKINFVSVALASIIAMTVTFLFL